MSYYLLQYRYGAAGGAGAKGSLHQTILRTRGNRYIIIGNLNNGKKDQSSYTGKWYKFKDRDLKLIMYPELHKYYSDLEFNRITKEEAFEIML